MENVAAAHTGLARLPAERSAQRAVVTAAFSGSACFTVRLGRPDRPTARTYTLRYSHLKKLLFQCNRVWFSILMAPLP
jgi:hypothetical protein